MTSERIKLKCILHAQQNQYKSENIIIYHYVRPRRMYCRFIMVFANFAIGVRGTIAHIGKKFFHFVGRPCQMANALLPQVHSKQLLHDHARRPTTHTHKRARAEKSFK